MLHLFLNEFLQQCSKHLSRYVLNIYFSNPDGSQQITRLFNDDQVHDNLEAFGFDSIYAVSSFLGGLVENLCSRIIYNNTTSAFKEYVGMMKILLTICLRVTIRLNGMRHH